MNIPFLDARRPQTCKMIQDLLKERQQMWALYLEFGKMKPFTSEQPLERLTQHFCQLLVDYLSLGHFGIYRRIVEGTERRAKVVETAAKIYPMISELTSVAVAFNDKYENRSGDALLLSLSEDLSWLGEALATRSELEDQLLASLVS